MVISYGTGSASPRPIPQVDILFLGSPGVGKATFLSRVPSVVHPSVSKREASSQPQPQQQSSPSTNSSASQLASPSATALLPAPDADARPPPYASTTSLPFYEAKPPNLSTSTSPTTLAPPLTGPLSFSVSLFARPYSITVHPSTSQIFIDAFPAAPRFAIIAFAINDKASLWNAKNYWSVQLKEHYPDEEKMRVMLLGLKRDARTDKKVPRRNWGGEGWRLGGRVSRGEAQATGAYMKNTKLGMGARESANVQKSALGQIGDAEWEYECVMPEEGLQVAREMRADRYAECSALTGELMWEVVEDITRTAAKTTVGESRENSGNGSCTIM